MEMENEECRRDRTRELGMGDGFEQEIGNEGCMEMGNWEWRWETGNEGWMEMGNWEWKLGMWDGWKWENGNGDGKLRMLMEN